MNNKLTKEQIKTITGTLPPEREGKELVGLELRKPKHENFYFSNSSNRWITANFDFNAETYLVAIYEDAKPELKRPEATLEGHTIAYYTGDEMDEVYKAGNKWGCYTGTTSWSSICDTGRYRSIKGCTYCIATPIARPTTIDDLVGGFIIAHTDGGFESIYAINNHMGGLEVNHGSIAYHVERENRWSHSHRTAYVDANDFVA